MIQKSCSKKLTKSIPNVITISVWVNKGYLSVDEPLVVVLEVSRSIGDGGEDGAHLEKDDGHDDEDDVAVSGHVKLSH